MKRFFCKACKRQRRTRRDIPLWPNDGTPVRKQSAPREDGSRSEQYLYLPIGRCYRHGGDK